MVDLHIHTTASDGQYSPEQIVQKAHEKSISTIAITDHDTINGLPKAMEEGKKLGVNVVPGVELNISGFPGEFHLLGLGLKNPSKSLHEILQKVIENRNERNRKIIEKMQNDGIEISFEEMQEKYSQEELIRNLFQ